MSSGANHASERRLRVAETITVIVRLGVVAVLLFCAWMADVEMGRVERTQDVIAHVDEVQRNLLRTQVSQRTYALAGDSAAWAAYRATTRQLDGSIGALDQRLSGDTTQQRRLVEVTALLARVKEYPSRASDGPALTAGSAAAALLARDRMLVHTGLAAALSTIQRSEHEKLAAQRAAQHRTIRLLIVLAFTAVVLAIVIGLGTLRFRRQAVDTLLHGELMFRRLADDNPDGVLLIVDEAIVYANGAAEALLDAPTGGLTGRSVLTVIHPEDRALVSQRMAGVLADGTQTPPRELRYLRTDGSTIDIEARGARVTFQQRAAIQVVMRDLSSRRETERALRESEARYRMLADNSGDLITRRDRHDVIVYASPSHRAVLGWTPEELVGTAAMPMLHPEDLPHTRAVRLRAEQTGSSLMRLSRVRHKAGHYVWLDIVEAPLRTADGQPDGYVVSARDASARLRLEDELRQSQKMEVLGRMASGVAHDFNNLLTVIRSSAELLRSQESGAAPRFDVVSDIDLATDRAAALTAHLLTFSRSQHYSPTLLRFAPLIRDAAPILSRLAGDAVRITLDIDDDAEAAWIWADTVRLEQVLVNLVGNARDSMPHGGAIGISCAAITLSETVSHRFGTILPGNYFTLAIEDEGTGITEDVLAHLFDPFYTTKPQGRGTGLGLSTVYGIVTEALGSIIVTSEHGRGSRFTVYWPRTDAPAESAAVAPVITARRKPTPLPEPRQKPKRILLVDDDDAVRRVVARQIEAGGYTVRSVSSAAAALEVLRSPDAPFDAMVTDVRMPDMTGIELVAQLMSDGVELPVLLVSGQLDAQFPDTWPVSDQRKFLAKPISGKALQRALEDLIAPLDTAGLPG